MLMQLGGEKKVFNQSLSCSVPSPALAKCSVSPANRKSCQCTDLKKEKKNVAVWATIYLKTSNVFKAPSHLIQQKAHSCTMYNDVIVKQPDS